MIGKELYWDWKDKNVKEDEELTVQIRVEDGWIDKSGDRRIKRWMDK